MYSLYLACLVGAMLIDYIKMNVYTVSMVLAIKVNNEVRWLAELRCLDAEVHFSLR